ncbi:fasciclin domain-containing protein [Micromonospora sp. NPDC003197]
MSPLFPGRMAAAVLALTMVTSGCSSAEPGTAGGATADGATAASGSAGVASVTGPLCELLPSGTDPGNPAMLTGEPVDVALQWIPVLTTFEAALRASGLADELRARKGLTILAPTDDAFIRKFSEDNLDELLLKRKDELRDLIKAHAVDGSHSLADLVEAGGVTTLDGASVPVTRTDAMARIGTDAATLCVDYRVTDARFHIISRVLGKLPTTADGSGHRAH